MRCWGGWGGGGGSGVGGKAVGQSSCSFPSDIQEVLGLLAPRHRGLGQQAGDGLVAHRADTAYLKPLEQTPEERRRKKERP